MATGVQPVPMGTFRSEMTTPSRPARMPASLESTSLALPTHWQHWAPLVEPEPPVGAAETTPARATVAVKSLENILGDGYLMC
jgi:hypothetical protein